MARGRLSNNIELLLPYAHALIVAEWPRIEIIATALLQRRELDYVAVRWLLP
jgi:hypothetical protein